MSDLVPSSGRIDSQKQSTSSKEDTYIIWLMRMYRYTRILKMGRTRSKQQAFLLALLVLRMLFVNMSKFSTVMDSSKSKDMSNIDHSLVVERALGETTSARTASILSKAQNNTKLSIVISHCNSPVGWIARYMENVKFEIADITIVSKCGEQVVGVDLLEQSFGTNIIIQHLPNVGRCDHTYAHWILGQ